MKMTSGYPICSHTIMSMTVMIAIDGSPSQSGGFSIPRVLRNELTAPASVFMTQLQMKPATAIGRIWGR